MCPNAYGFLAAYCRQLRNPRRCSELLAHLLDLGIELHDLVFHLCNALFVALQACKKEAQSLRKATLALSAMITWMANRFPAVPVVAPRSRSTTADKATFFSMPLPLKANLSDRCVLSYDKKIFQQAYRDNRGRTWAWFCVRRAAWA